MKKLTTILVTVFFMFPLAHAINKTPPLPYRIFSSSPVYCSTQRQVFYARLLGKYLQKPFQEICRIGVWNPMKKDTL